MRSKRDDAGLTWDGYVSRWEFLHERCRGKTVLHLGFIGDSDIASLSAPNSQRVSLHEHLRSSARWLVGIDHDRATIEALTARGIPDIFWGDVEHLQAADLDSSFDVEFDIVLCGHLIQYVSNPGLMLEGIKPFMTAHSELILSAPNAFGAVRFLRYSTNRLHERRDWVLMFSQPTITQLLEKHGFTVTATYTSHDRFARPHRNRRRYQLGIPFLKRFPRFGGSLLVVARLAENAHPRTIP